MRTLTCDPVLHCDDIMVVFEGKDRLILHRGEGEQWRVRALWPEPADVRALHAHLGEGRPLLVVLDGEPPVVPLLPEECAGAAWGPDLAGVSTDDGELVEFRIPRLDWLCGRTPQPRTGPPPGVRAAARPLPAPAAAAAAGLSAAERRPARPLRLPHRRRRDLRLAHGQGRLVPLRRSGRARRCPLPARPHPPLNRGATP